MNGLDVLRERGFVHQVSNESALRQALERPTTVYCGYDPTRDSLQVGNLVSIMMLAHLQRAGHRPVALIGGGTGLVGDPSGKTEMRQMLTVEQIDLNAQGLRGQFARYIDFTSDRALLLNNADWLLKLGYITFLRDIGRHFSVNQLLQHETYRSRLQDDGLNFIELNYALLQAYDFLHLYRELGCLLQIGGSDQWFNILAGVDLIRRETAKEAFALVSPLIETTSGVKMGKTEAGAVWLDADRTSPYTFYQFWINTEDEDVERFLKLFTFLPLDEIARLAALAGAELRAAKETLAFEVTHLTHGTEAAEQARASARALFGGGGGGDLSSMPTTVVAGTRLDQGINLIDVLVEVGLSSSRSVAKAAIQGGGIYINGQRINRLDSALHPDDLVDGQILVRRGKKEYRRLIVG
jgi:tyrosyl-tRNA synthetase